MTRKRLIWVFIILPVIYVSGQNSRSHYKAAQQFIDNGYFEEAIQQYNKAIELDPQFGQAYEDRGKAYEKTGKLHESAADYERAAVFGTNAAENYLKSATIHNSLGETDNSLEALDKAIIEKPNYQEAFLLQNSIYFKAGNFKEALESAEDAILCGNTAYAIYIKGNAEFGLRDYISAERDFEKAISKDKLLTDAYLQLAKVQLELGKNQSSIDNCSYVIQLDRNNSDAYAFRSLGYKNINEVAKAISDISVSISIDSLNMQYYILRGECYLYYAQYQNAINDFTIVLNNDMLNFQALKNRAVAFEKLGKNDKAASDYYLLLKISDNADSQNTNILVEKIYNLQREYNKPNVSVSAPVINKNLEIPIPSDKNEIELCGTIADESKIKILRINTDTLLYDIQGKGITVFDTKLSTENLEFVTISATDIYNNTSTISYAVIRTETRLPGIILLNPYVGDDNLIKIETDDKFLYLEGKINDESLISSIQIDETNASFIPGNINPRFTATIDIAGKNRINISVIDIFGNKIEKEYLFQKDGRVLSENNPMGKTWVILIGNSEYENFTNLRSPSTDIDQVHKALDRYKISNFIIKKNLTKKELERFFSLDLRDLIRTNHVNSLFIWFAGHGININGNGYWIPSDAISDDEFSYYNINALKASLYSYNSLTHLLVVSDACSTGPGFNIAERGPGVDISCSQMEMTDKKSAQVFTSAGPGSASDNSLFARSFSYALLNNENDCVAIDDIAKRVKIIIQGNSSQGPEFGRIAGLDDEKGTFFFISR